jgi:hypothetical protein
VHIQYTTSRLRSQYTPVAHFVFAEVFLPLFASSSSIPPAILAPLLPPSQERRCNSPICKGKSKLFDQTTDGRSSQEVAIGVSSILYREITQSWSGECAYVLIPETKKNTSYNGPLLESITNSIQRHAV